MSDESRADLALVRDARERVIATLSTAFADGDIEMEEFERRLTLAHRTESVAALDALVRDVTAPVAAPPVAPPPQPHGARAALAVAAAHAGIAHAGRHDPGRDEQWAVSIMGNTLRRGHWTPPRIQRVLNVMGNVELDYREATLVPGVSEVVVSVIMGSVEIIVPPSLAVEMSGSAIMGSFDHSERAPLTPDPERPVLRVSGVSIMGSVSILTRLPGESGWDAFMRRRRERKALRESAKTGLLTPGKR